jgi:hypothetical protein
MNGHTRVLLAGVLWALSAACLFSDITEGIEHGLGAAAGVLAVLALVPTVDMIVEHRMEEHRRRLQHILEIFDGDGGGDNVSRLRDRR